MRVFNQTEIHIKDECICFLTRTYFIILFENISIRLKNRLKRSFLFLRIQLDSNVIIFHQEGIINIHYSRRISIPCRVFRM